MKILLLFLLNLAIATPPVSVADTDTSRLQLLETHRAYRAEGKFVEDYMLLSQAAGRYKEERNWAFLADTHNKIGNLFDLLNEQELALKHFKEAEEYFDRCGDSISTTKIQLNIANNYFERDMKQEALDILLPLERNPIARQDTAYHASVLFSLLRSLLDAGDMPSYHRYVAVLDSLPLHNDILRYKRDTHIGFYHYLRHEYDTSEQLYRRALHEARQHNDPSAATALLGLIYNFTATARYDSATVYWEKYHDFTNSTEHTMHATQIKQMESLNTIRNYELQLRQEQEKMRLHRLISILAFALIIIIVAASIVLLHSRKKQALIERELEEAKNRELTTMLENERLQNESRRLELEDRNRRLCLNLMILEEKANALKSIQQQIMNANADGKVPADIARTIDNQIKYHLQDASNWHAFKESFERIHPTFFNKLKERFPRLSEHELRFCAFACSGLDSKQIAFILNIQIESIRKIRQRLRKKLGLEASESLEDFLRGFTE